MIDIYLFRRRRRVTVLKRIPWSNCQNAPTLLDYSRPFLSSLIQGDKGIKWVKRGQREHKSNKKRNNLDEKGTKRDIRVPGRNSRKNNLDILKF